MSTHVAETSATGHPRPTLLREGAELNHSTAPSATYTSRSTASAADIGPEFLPGFLSFGRSTSRGGARPVLERRSGGAKRRSGGVKNRAHQGPTPRDAERLQNYSPPLRGWHAPIAGSSGLRPGAAGDATIPRCSVSPAGSPPRFGARLVLERRSGGAKRRSGGVKNETKGGPEPCGAGGDAIDTEGRP